MLRELFGLALVVSSGGVLAQQPPSAGNQIQQIPASPPPPKQAPEMRVEREGEPGAAAAAIAPDQARITVARLHLTNLHVFSEAQLRAAAGFRPGSAMTLPQLREMASRIATHYHEHGYFLAHVYLPAQDVKDGTVTIAVLEGQYGNVSLRNRSEVSDQVAQGLLDGLNRADPVVIGPLESRLLLLSDIPGVSVKSTLIPGASVGSTDLIVDLAPGPRVVGSIDADNHGNRYTGPARIGATLNVNALAGYGDVLTLRALTSAAGLTYGRLSYQIPAGRATAGVAYASMDYRLGQDFARLQAHGTAHIASVYGSYPLIRSRSNNLYARINVDAKAFRDRQDASATFTNKNATAVMASLNGDRRDSVGGGGYSRYALTWTSGQIDIRSPLALATDAATVGSNGRYDKLGLSASRLQSLTPTTALYAALNGQLNSKNLDVSEKMELGGAGAVRAYPEGEAYADRGYVLTLEARRSLPAVRARLPGQLQLVGFIDHGSATLDKHPWVAGRNRRTLSAAGLGIDWAGDNGLVVKAYVARKLGNAAASSAPDARYRFWIEAVKYF